MAKSDVLCPSCLFDLEEAGIVADETDCPNCGERLFIFRNGDVCTGRPQQLKGVFPFEGCEYDGLGRS